MINEQLKRIIVSRILRYQLDQCDISQIQLANQLKKSRQNLNQIFKGKISIYPRTINQILQELGVNDKFFDNDEKYEELCNLLNVCLKEFYCCEFDKCLNHINEIENLSYKYSYFTPKRIIALAVKYSIVEDYDGLFECISVLENYFSDVLDNESEIAYLILASDYEIENGDFESALKHLDKASKISTLLYDATGMIYMFIGMIHFWRWQPIQAIVNDNKAISFFERTSNFYRLVAVFNNIGACYVQLKEFDIAESYFLQSVNRSKQIGREKTLIGAYSNLANMYRQSKRYEESIEYGKMTLSKSRNNVSAMLSVAWSSFYLNDLKTASDYKKMIIPFIHEGNRRNLFIELLDLYINQKEIEAKISKLEEMVYLFDKDGDRNNMMFCAEMLLDELEKTQDYKKLYKYQKTVLNVYHY